MYGLCGQKLAPAAGAAVILISVLLAGSVSAREPVKACGGMVASVSPPATEVGLAALQRGGTAVDAAVAVAFALAVTFPEAGNIGGGGFMVVRPGGGSDPAVIDYREVAPRAATRELFATLESKLGHKAVGVPGTVRGLAAAHQRFGRLSWKEVVQPAVEIAERGLTLDGDLAGALNRLVGQSSAFPEFCRVYGKDGGKAAWAAGDCLVQKELARTLRQIAEEGPDAFYRGPIADLIVAEMQRGGGLVAKEDLGAYTPQVKAPLRGSYRGHEILCPPPPTGGTVLVEMLNILENFDLRSQGRWSPETIHLMIEAMRLAYFDRACYLADPGFVRVPEFLVDKAYARRLAESIDRNRAGSSAALAGSRQITLADEGPDTTHFSVIDESGMAVANTYTLEHSYGSRVVVQGGGFLLNNEMGDFNWKPGRTDRTGTIGTEPNLIEPGKRMLSSQTPTIVTKDGQVVLITGSPGGRTIINTVLQVVLNVTEFEMDPAAAVDAPRFHHQWLPDRVVFERRLEADHPDLMRELKAMGHTIGKPSGSQGDAHTIWVESKTGQRHGVADLRRKGCALGY